MGRGVAAKLPSNRATPTASCPRGARGTAANVPSTTTPGATQPQPGSREKPKHPDPALLAVKLHSGGWRKDLEHVLKVYYKYNTQAPFRESEWVRVKELFFDRFLQQKDEALAIKEGAPLDYMPLITEEFWRATGLCLHGLPEFTLWIKRGSYYHGLLVERDQLQECPHLIGAPLPRWPQPKPSESRQNSYR